MLHALVLLVLISMTGTGATAELDCVETLMQQHGSTRKEAVCNCTDSCLIDDITTRRDDVTTASLNSPDPPKPVVTIAPQFQCIREQLFSGVHYVDALCICVGRGCSGIDELKDALADFRRQNEIEHVSAKGVLYCLIFIFGISGNILVIVTVAKYMGRLNITNLYVCNLAVADLLVCAICIPIKTIENIVLNWTLGEEACKFFLWLYFGCFMCSVFTLTCMSVERYLAICHPMRKHLMTSKTRAVITITLIWPIAGALGAVVPIFSKVHGSSCVIHEDGGVSGPVYLYLTILILLVPAVIMGFCYIRICQELWESIKKQRALKGSGNAENGTGQGKEDTAKEKEKDDNTTLGRIQVIKMLMAVWIVFIICWTPYLLLRCYETVHDMKYSDWIPNRQVVLTVTVYLNLLSLANSALNPVLYGVLSRPFRMGFLRCLTCGKRGVEKRAVSYASTTGAYAASSQVTSKTELTVVNTKEQKV